MFATPPLTVPAARHAVRAYNAAHYHRSGGYLIELGDLHQGHAWRKGPRTVCIRMKYRAELSIGLTTASWVDTVTLRGARVIVREKP